MTRNDYEQHGLEYYESKKESKDDDGAKTINVQPESGVKKSDSLVANELFGPIWDDINLKDDGVVESRERACKPVVEHYTSE